MPHECGCHGENQNCFYCFGSGYVQIPADSSGQTSADERSSAQLLLAERWHAAEELRYALADERARAEERLETLRRASAEERIKAGAQAGALCQALADERRSAETLRYALAEERTRAEAQAAALRQALADERRLSGNWRSIWERERDERTKAENRCAALATALAKAMRQGQERAYGTLIAAAVVVAFVMMKSCS